MIVLSRSTLYELMTCDANPVRLDPLHSLSRSLNPLSGELNPETLTISGSPGLCADTGTGEVFNLNIRFRFALTGPWALPASKDRLADEPDPEDIPDLPR